MSQQYRYDTSKSLPRLMRDVDVIHPLNSSHQYARAKIDTGADITTVPNSIVKRLGLLPGGEKELGGFNGPAAKRQTFYARIKFEGIEWPRRVVATDRDYLLIGLDILNNFKMYADGKAQSFTLEDP